MLDKKSDVFSDTAKEEFEDRLKEGDGEWLDDTTCELHTDTYGVVTGTVEEDGSFNWK